MAENDDFEEETIEQDDELLSETEKSTPKDKLQIRRKLEDRLEELRMRQNFDSAAYYSKDE